MGFGNQSSWQGLYRVLAFRESQVEEFNRGKYGQGVRGYIDPLEMAPANAYGPKNSAEFLEMEKFLKESAQHSPRKLSVKHDPTDKYSSLVSGTTMDATGMGDQFLDINISKISLDDSV